MDLKTINNSRGVPGLGTSLAPTCSRCMTRAVVPGADLTRGVEAREAQDLKDSAAPGVVSPVHSSRDQGGLPTTNSSKDHRLGSLTPGGDPGIPGSGVLRRATTSEAQGPLAEALEGRTLGATGHQALGAIILRALSTNRDTKISTTFSRIGMILGTTGVQTLVVGSTNSEGSTVQNRVRWGGMNPKCR